MWGVRDPAKLQCCICGGRVESALHVITDCQSREAALLLLKWVRKISPSASLFDVFHLSVSIKGSVEESTVTMLTAMTVHTLWVSRERGGVSPVSLSAEVAVLTKTLSNTKYIPQARIIQNISNGI